MVIYHYSCCCKASYFRLTTRHLSKRIKEHAPKSEENFYFSDMKSDILVKILNASKSLTIAEHLVDNSTCANSYNLNRLKTNKTCSNVLNLTKLKAICTL